MRTIDFTRAERELIRSQRTPSIEVPSELSGKQIPRLIENRFAHCSAQERIERFLKYAEHFKTQVLDTITYKSITNATISTVRNLYRDAIDLIRSELKKANDPRVIGQLRSQLEATQSTLNTFLITATSVHKLNILG